MTFLEGCMSDISPAYLRAELGSVVQYLDDTLGDWIELRGVLGSIDVDEESLEFGGFSKRARRQFLAIFGTTKGELPHAPLLSSTIKIDGEVWAVDRWQTQSKHQVTLHLVREQISQDQAPTLR